MLHIVFGECESNFNLERLESELLESILRYNYDQLKDSYLTKYMDCLSKNLNDVLMCPERNHSLKNEEILETNRLIKQLKIVQKTMKILRYVYVSEINGCVEHEKLKGLDTRIQFMADNVGQIFFLFGFVGMKKKQSQQKKQMPKRMKKKHIQKKHFMKRMKKKKTRKKMKKKRIQKKQTLKRMKKKQIQKRIRMISRESLIVYFSWLC
ncbi:hypothetical protein RDI58_017056 [Solanum bulbocastanum]|uniref:Uncharacterized protein n=1 Tax=Solanum bulbocastanum TaxID=147425 RepID=A0AAN8TEA7_SOLBU